MAEIRDWFNTGSAGRTGTNLFAPAPTATNPTPSLASSNFGGSTNAWDMPSYGGSTNTAPSGTQTLASPNFNSSRNASDMPTYGGLQPTTAPATNTKINTLASPNFTNTNVTAVPSTPKPSAPQPAPAVPSSGQTGGGQQPAGGGSWDWFGGKNPWNTNVTAGTVNPDLSAGPQTSFTSGGWNVNYPTEEAAKSLGNMFGANVLGQNLTGDYGPAGAPSAPMYGLDFGIGDPQNAGQVAYWLQRGDSLPDIQARLSAGIAPPLGPGQGNKAFDWNATPVQTFAGTPGNGSLNTGVNPSTHLGPIGGPTTNLQPGAVSGGGTVRVPPVQPPTGTTPGTAPTGPPSGASNPINWANWNPFMNSNYFPLAEPGANEQAINANITPQMMSNPTLAAYLGITPQSPLSTAPPGSAGAASNPTTDNFTNLFNIFRGLGGTPEAQAQNQNPFWQTFLQAMMLTPQMYLR